jgi:hypothetical protein
MSIFAPGNLLAQPVSFAALEEFGYLCFHGALKSFENAPTPQSGC